METAFALIAGGFIGAVLGFVGAGGAMLSVPILMYGFDFSPKAATTAALAVVLLAALSGLMPKVRKKQVLYRDAFVISGIGSIANLGFSSIVDQIPDSVITTGFAGILILAGASMLRPPRLDEHKRMPLPVLVLMALIIGTMTGLFGIGGGFLAIPALVLYFGTPQIVAAGTSLLIIAINSLISFIGHRPQWSDVQWHIPILMGASAIVIAQVASQLAHKTSPVVLRKAFAFLLFAISIFTLVKTYL
jgi:uncharacterized membrane protein YfcA